MYGILGDHTFRLKWNYPLFGHHVPLFQQTSNGTFFIPFLKDGLVLISLFLNYFNAYFFINGNNCNTEFGGVAKERYKKMFLRF